MANVGFKVGSQSQINNLKDIDEGSFYLASDTNQLYIGKNNNSLSALNQNIIIVDKLIAEMGDPEDTSYLPSLAEAAKTSALYYVKTGNILCAIGDGKWVQVNPIGSSATEMQWGSF